jgi:hypothetical protein
MGLKAQTLILDDKKNTISSPNSVPIRQRKSSYTPRK